MNAVQETRASAEFADKVARGEGYETSCDRCLAVRHCVLVEGIMYDVYLCESCYTAYAHALRGLMPGEVAS